MEIPSLLVVLVREAAWHCQLVNGGGLERGQSYVDGRLLDSTHTRVRLLIVPSIQLLHHYFLFPRTIRNISKGMS